MTVPDTPRPRETSLARRTFTVTSVVVAVIVLMLLLWLAREVLLLMCAAALVAVLLRFMRSTVARHTPLGDTWALTVVIAALVGAMTAAVWLSGPPVVVEFQALGAGMMVWWSTAQPRPRWRNPTSRPSRGSPGRGSY